MKEKKIEQTAFIYQYEAFDGTIFITKDECQKYEDSALGVIKSRVWDYKLEKEYNAWELMGGYDDHKILAFKVPDITIADDILHWICIKNSYYLKEDHFNEVRKKVYSAIGDIIIFGQDCDGECYLINSKKNILNNLNSIGND